MKQNFIYLDWNVIKTLKTKEDDMMFPAIIETLKTKFVMPFSFAHLCDLQKNLNSETKSLIKSDLDFLQKVSAGYMLDTHEDDYDISKKNIFKKYDEVTQNKIMQYSQPSIPKAILEQIKKVGLQRFFEDKKNLIWFGPVFLNAFGRFECNPELYMMTREIFKLNPPKELYFLAELQKPGLTSEKLKKVTDEFMKLDSNNTTVLRDKMNIAYLLLDYNSDYREKISTKSNFTNIYTDSNHMINASFAKYYITQDKKTIKKTKFVFESFGIKTKIFDIKTFIEHYEL